MAPKILLLSLMLTSGAALAALPAELSGSNLMPTPVDVKIATANKENKGTVVVFLSAKCPCSDSHITELKSLFEKYKDFKFVGIHSNVDEDLEFSKKYFVAQALPFPVLQDEKATLADTFKAFKTPHAYVLSPEGEIVFQGGITNSANGKDAKVHYLADALEDIQQGHKIKTASVRTLGCVILREKNTW
ncbi:MAG: redoxin domain-containing protein [Bdellovibrionales bacterium]|nr:redoxin domain-containing protein [Bdellovibrionales bacterium]